jgi:hypothetical protein
VDIKKVCEVVAGRNESDMDSIHRIEKEPRIFDKVRPTLKDRVADVSRHGEFVFAMVASRRW